MRTRYLKIKTENEWEYFNSESGGNNRQWVKRYKDMIKAYAGFSNMPPSKGKKDFLRGFKACVDIFHERDNILETRKEEGE